MDTNVFYNKNKKKKAFIPPESSEDEMFSDDDSLIDKTYEPNEEHLSESEESSTNDSDNGDDTEQQVQADVREHLGDISNLQNTHIGINREKVKKRNIVWKENSSKESRPTPPWLGELPRAFSVETPIQYFRKIIDQDLLNFIVWQTNLYAKQINVASNFNIDIKELEQFMGICFYMSLISVPGTRRYWNTNCCISQVAEVMSVRRFEEIKKYLHFSDNSIIPTIQPPDRIFKIRGLVDRIKKNLNQIPMEEFLSVDEQMVPFKGRSSLKQYNPQKPKKWGYKIFCLAGSSGIIYDFEIYSGSVSQPTHLPDINQSSNVVLRLSEIIPANKHFQLYCDNWFNCPELQIELAKKGIYSIGTVRPNRVPNSRMPTDKEMKEHGRGTSIEKLGNCEGITLSMVKWQDNRSVNLLSSFAGVNPETTVRRFDRKTKANQEIMCPKIVKMYNKCMGGVDSMDSLLGLYRTLIRSKKYYLRFYFHFMDLCAIVAWLLYRRAGKECGLRVNEQLALFDFKLDLAQSLCWLGKRQRGRPSCGTPSCAPTPKRTRQIAPNLDCRKDKYDHWPTYSKKNRCKMIRGEKTCQAITKVKCTKCDINLCFVPERNCFMDFHS